MKKVLFLLLAVTVFFSGCTGSFNLTKTVYSWHRAQDERWSDEVGFLVCALTPVYGLSMMADAILLNSIEFWTGENPVKKTKITKGESKTEISFSRQKNQMKITSKTGDKADQSITLERGDNAIYTKDQSGKVIYTTLMDKGGQVLVFNQGMELVKKYKPSEVKQMGEKYIQ